MFKIETVVKLALFTGMVFAQISACAEGNTINNTNTLNDTAYKNLCVPKAKPGKEAFCTRWENASVGTGATDDACTTSAKDYAAAKKEFSTACGEANIAMDGGGPFLGCSRALTQCGCAGKGNGDKQIGQVSCSGVAGAGEEESSSRRSSKTSSEESATLNTFKYCPSKAAKNYDKIKEDKEKAEEKADDLEKDLPTKMDDANKAKSDGQEKIDSIDEKMTTAQSDYEKKQLELQKNKSDAQKAVMNQVSQLQSQLQQLDEQISQMDLAVGEAAMKRDETKKQIQLNCHASAAAQASKKMGEFADLVRAGKANVGGQKDMFKRVGTTLDTIFDREALKIYNKCLASKPTLDSMDSANVVYDSAVKQAEQSKTNARKRKDQVAEQIKQLKDPSGNCGQVTQSADGTTNETDMCRTVREAVQAQQQAYTEFQRNQKLFNKQRDTVAQQATQNYNMKMNAYMTAQQNAIKQRAKADSLARMLQAADDSGGGGVDSKAYATANGKFGALTEAAGILITCPLCPTGSGCREAADYLSAIGNPTKPAPAVDNAPVNITDTTLDNGTDGPQSKPATGKGGEKQNPTPGASR